MRITYNISWLYPSTFLLPALPKSIRPPSFIFLFPFFLPSLPSFPPSSLLSFFSPPPLSSFSLSHYLDLTLHSYLLLELQLFSLCVCVCVWRVWVYVSWVYVKSSEVNCGHWFSPSILWICDQTQVVTLRGKLLYLLSQLNSPDSTFQTNNLAQSCLVALLSVFNIYKFRLSG